MDTGTRLREIAKDNGLNLNEFSEALGVQYRTLVRYVSEGREPKVDFLRRLTDRFDISASWLISGEGPKCLSEVPDSTEFVTIQRYTVSASAGDGTIAGEYLDVSDYAFRLEWIKRRHLDHKMLNVIEVRGDSMEPRLSAGDLILIDRAQTDPTDGNTYVLRLGEELVVKNMQRIDRETIALISNNTIYPPRQVRAVDIGPTEEVDIIGRVVASMHEW